jgi:hypothetical protein
VSEFLAGYYGAAAPFLNDYIDTIQDAFIKNGGPLTCYQRDCSYLTLDVMNRATNDFRHAEQAVAGNAILSRRVRLERLALDRAWLVRYYPLRREAAARKAVFEGPQDTDKVANDFVESLHEFNISKLSEGGNMDSDIEGIVAAARPPAPLPDFLRGIDADRVIDASPASMNLIGHIGAKLIVDPTSPTGYSGTMPGDTNDWAMQYSPSDKQLAAGQWHCYIFARVDARDTAKSGTARASVFQGSRAVQAFVPGKFTVLDAGVHPWTLGTYVWIAPPNRQDIASIYVGRILLVRE